MRALKIPIITLALFILAGGQNIYAQTPLRQEALKKLSELKPPDDKNYVYKIIVPPERQILPANLRLDIVYKIGHYDFRYVALRFEKEKNADFVNVTRFVYGSALGFWKESSANYSEGDAFTAERGKLPAADFEKLLRLAYLLHQSNIEKRRVQPETVRRDAGGRIFVLGRESETRTFSSCDGIIVLNLSGAKNNPRPVIKESGTLYCAALKDRIPNRYENLRTHVFWEIFDDYLEKQNVFTALDKAKAEEIAAARLAEPPLVDDYADYFRQALYVEILGETGTTKVLPILKKLSEGNSLEKAWNEYLMRDAAKAIEKIGRREKPDE